MGDKSKARGIMRAAGVLVTPGSDGIIADETEALAIAHDLGYPVVIKASAGGGGCGIRVAHTDASLIQGFHSCRREAERSFGSSEIYIEKFIEKMRHVEIQIMADEHGNVVHLGERDCSIQRRRQKLIEESPCPALDESLRADMGQAAVLAAQVSDYTNAGTVEFILTPDKQFYFMEMNTRIQVEHPVTEMVTGIDLVKEQIRIAAGEPLGYTQDDIELNGHAIECRINAENPQNGFTPCPGLVSFYCPPGGLGVRIDSHVYSGYIIPPYYDSMIGKLIVHGKNRAECIVRCRRALSEFLVEGIHTTIPFQQQILLRQDFIRGEYDTGTVEQILADGITTAPP
jgi:acetyl-CoA carboxylase biotin carboxylase subunit